MKRITVIITIRVFSAQNSNSHAVKIFKSVIKFWFIYHSGL